jgi:nuclear cap-binding protein subunit 1
LYIWEILHLTIRKMSKYVSRLSRELSESREKLARSGGGGSSSGEDSDDSRSGRGAEDKPTEEMVERMEERLEAAQADQKNLFLIIFQVFKTLHSKIEGKEVH